MALVEAGYVTRRRGSGSYVTERRRMPHGLDSTLSYLAMIESATCAKQPRRAPWRRTSGQSDRSPIRTPNTGYFERRKLRRHAAFWSLWALGVGAVISGDFYGWNLGLDAGGFGGLLIAGIVITVMYYGLCYSIAEMSPALPHTGGAYSFARSAMGPWGGFITGLGREHGVRHHPRGRRGRDGFPLA